MSGSFALRQCVQCGASFEPTTKTQKFCGASCRAAPRRCEVCSKEFARPYKTRDSRRCCSRACGHELERRERLNDWVHWRFYSCVICEARFIRRGSKRFCSSACQMEHARREDRLRTVAQRLQVVTKKCRQCGAGFEVRRVRGDAGRPICTACSQANTREWKRDNKSHHSRARRAGVPYVSVSRKEVIAKYGMKCSICKRKIPVNPSTPEEAFTLDHVVPLSLGGWHDLSNLRPAHHQCNSLKAAQFRGQLMLSVAQVTQYQPLREGTVNRQLGLFA